MKKSAVEKKSSSKESEEKKHASQKEEILLKPKEKVLPPRKVVHSKHSPSKRDERRGNKTVKDGIKSNDVLDHVTVKISCDNNKTRNVEVRSGSGSGLDKRSREDCEKKIKAVKDAGDKK